jgi:hypothetical protein
LVLLSPLLFRPAHLLLLFYTLFQWLSLNSSHIYLPFHQKIL